MSTKNLARTAIEVGRRSHNRWERNYSHKQERARARQYLRAVEKDPEDAFDIVAKERPRVMVEQDDKLGPVYKFLESRCGRPWSEVYSEIKARFDSRTIPGRHILYDHILRHMVVQWDHEHEYTYSYKRDGEGRKFYSRNYVVDEEGILRTADAYEGVPTKPRHPPGQRKKYPNNRARVNAIAAAYAWANGRKILTQGSKMFWGDPVRWTSEICYRANNHWTGYWGYIARYNRYTYCDCYRHYVGIDGVHRHELPVEFRQARELSKDDYKFWEDKIPEGIKDGLLHEKAGR